MTPNEILLEPAQGIRRDPDVGQLAESRVDAIDGVAVLECRLDSSAAPRDTIDRGGREHNRHSRVAGNADDLVDGEGGAVEGDGR